MRYTEEMMLQSKSGYCMPFEERGKDVELTLGYGKQKHPVTGDEFSTTDSTLKQTTICCQPWQAERYRALAMMRHTASTK